MAKADGIKHEVLRSQLLSAHQLMRTGKPTEAVRGIADAFLLLLRLKPELLTQTAEVRVGMQIPLVMRWPMLGANLKPGSVQAGKPEIVYVRDRFALSEAITYFEFTVETALDQRL